MLIVVKGDLEQDGGHRGPTLHLAGNGELTALKGLQHLERKSLVPRDV